eukprot:1033790-Rhodomonas_salina.2
MAGSDVRCALGAARRCRKGQQQATKAVRAIASAPLKCRPHMQTVQPRTRIVRNLGAFRVTRWDTQGRERWNLGAF